MCEFYYYSIYSEKSRLNSNAKVGNNLKQYHCSLNYFKIQMYLM